MEQQDVMCVLLQILLDKGLITQDIHDRAREKILETRDWPVFFDGKEAADGSTKDPG